MYRSFLLFAVLALFITIPESAYAHTTTLAVTPKSPIQGETIMVRLQGVKSATSVKKATFGGTPLDFVMYKNGMTALYGIDLNKKSGTYNLRISLNNETTFLRKVTIGKRNIKQTSVAIPEKLGGMATSSQTALINNLASDNKNITIAYKKTKEAYWSESFVSPLASTTVTGPYGNLRKTGAYYIAHKGTDLRAPQATPVYAINNGVVNIAQEYTVHGKTIIIDHGLGTFSNYLHLSKLLVNPRDKVSRGQVIGESGDSGYSLAPHLHFGVRVNKISIDPMQFLELFR